MNTKTLFTLIGNHLKINTPIIPKLKLRESGDLLTDNAEDNPNPSIQEIE